MKEVIVPLNSTESGQEETKKESTLPSPLTLVNVCHVGIEFPDISDLHVHGCGRILASAVRGKSQDRRWGCRAVWATCAAGTTCHSRRQRPAPPWWRSPQPCCSGGSSSGAWQRGRPQGVPKLNRLEFYDSKEIKNTLSYLRVKRYNVYKELSTSLTQTN